MRLIFLLFLITLLSNFAFGQLTTPEVESWQADLEDAETAGDSLLPLLHLGDYYVINNVSRAVEIKKWLDHQPLPEENLLRAEIYVLKGYLAQKRDQKNEARKWFSRAMELYRASQNYFELARLHLITVGICFSQGLRKEGQQHYQTAMELLRNHLIKRDRLYLQLGYINYYLNANRIRKEVALKRMLPELKNADDPWLLARAYYGMAGYYKDIYQFNKALAILDTALSYLDIPSPNSRIDRNRLYASIHYMRGWNYRYKTKYDSAIQEFKEGIYYAKKSGSEKLYSFNLKGLGNIYEIQKNYSQAYSLFLQSLEIEFKQWNMRQVAWNYNAIGNVFEGMGQYKEAKDYYKQAVTLNDSIGVKKYGSFDMDLASIYLKLDKPDSAIHTLLAGRPLSVFLEQGNYPEQILYMGKILAAQQNYSQAVLCFKEILNRENIREKLRIKTTTLIELCQLILTDPSILSYIEIQELGYSSLYDIFNQAYEQAELTGLIKLQTQAARLLSDFYKKNGNALQAMKYMEKYVLFHDSLVALKNAETLEELESEHKVRQKENEIALLQKEQQLSQLELRNARETRNRNVILWAGSIFFLFLFGGGLFARYRHLERLKLERLREKENLKLENRKKLEKVKAEFFSNMTHELRTPIALLQSPLEEMLRTESDPRKREYLEIMERNSHRLVQLANQLLDVNRLDNKSLELVPQYGDLVGFVSQVSQDFKLFASQKSIVFHQHFPDYPVEAVFDKERLEIVLINLFSNAIKFTDSGGKVTVNLEITDGENATLKVKDTGAGIPEEKQSKIFDRFYQAGATSSHKKGAGIGLSITKGLIELHHGEIAVESKVGEGTEFVIKLPLFALKVRQKDQSTVKNQAERNPDNKLPKSLDCKRILIIDDNADVRLVLSRLLENEYQLAYAENGREGINMAIEHIPDLIISDIMMPEMDGMEMLETIKNDYRTDHIPFIFLTAKGQQKSKIQGLQNGADDYLSKPFNNEELRLKVKNIFMRMDSVRKRYQENAEEDTSRNAPPTRQEIFIKKVTEVIKDNIEDSDFNVDELSNTLHMSRSQLYRKLQATTGKGPKDFIKNVRLNRAKELLENEKISVSEACYKVGFSNPSYFSVTFKKTFGISPSNVA